MLEIVIEGVQFLESNLVRLAGHKQPVIMDLNDRPLSSSHGKIPKRMRPQSSFIDYFTLELLPLGLLLVSSVVLAAILSSVMTWALRPLLSCYALARPNARSSHQTPTPQGGGLAVISATLIVASFFITLLQPNELGFPASVFGATLFIAAVGAADDVKPIPVLPRLVLQTLAVGTVLFSAPATLHILPACPLWLERGVLLVAGLWFVNLVNFMDGLDLMTVSETVPITAALVTLGLTGDLNPTISLVAAALGGAVIGFAPFNRPVARIFLGDVGSLPIGLLLGWGLLELAYRDHLIAALLLPLYYLSDATTTVLSRLFRGDKIWIAHRKHFYQRATANGFTVTGVVSTVFALNLGLVGLALASVAIPSSAARITLFIIGALAVASVMSWFARQR